MAPSALTDFPELPATREALHRVAEEVLSARRVEATGNEIALTVRGDAVATPDLPGGGWVGFAGTHLLVADAAGAVTRHRLVSLRQAARDAGLVAWAGRDDTPLALGAAAAAFLSSVYSFAAPALEALRAEAPAAADPSPIRLWPEHFDIAYEQGDEEAGTRAGFGVSPGDGEHDEPYAYVTPWSAPPAGPLWQATGFPGAELGWSAVAAAPDRLAHLLDFWRTRRDALSG